MLDENEILEIYAGVLAAEKIRDRIFGEKKPEFPPYRPLYAESVNQAIWLAYHADGTMPEKIFKNRAPNQDPKEHEYMKDNYQPITKQPWANASKTLNRKWNQDNYTITWPTLSTPFDKEEKSPQTYFTKQYPVYKSIFNYFSSIIDHFRTKDGNAVIAVKPFTLPTKIVDDKIVIDQTELIEPIAQLYPSEALIRFEEERFALCLTAERVKLSDDARGEKSGRVFELYDKDTIWKLTETGRKNKRTIIITVFWEHNWNRLPVWQLRGTPVQQGEHVFYEAIFSPASPELNNVIYDSASLRVSKNAHAFPVRAEFQDDCNKCKGEKFITNDKGNRHTCPSCNGTGFQDKYSLLGVYRHKAGDRLQEGDEKIPFPGVTFVSPDPTILEFNDKQIVGALNRAFQFLGLRVSPDDVKGNDTALGKLIDRDEQFAFLLADAEQVFDLLENTIDAIGFMRYKDNWEPPVITRPVNFNIRTEEEITAEIADAKTNGLPPLEIKKLMRDKITKRYALDASMQRRADIVFFTNPLITMSEVEINAALGSKRIVNWQAILNTEIDNIIDEKLIEDKKFLEKKDADIKKALEDEAKDREKERFPVINTTDNLLALANGDLTGQS